VDQDRQQYARGDADLHAEQERQQMVAATAAKSARE
jgi:hypothetical protein